MFDDNYAKALAELAELRAKIAAAAEALALVAWAEEKKAGIDYLCGTWYCGVGDEDAFAGKTFLGCIRAAKEAYEKEK
jgi:hypothetical protein